MTVILTVFLSEVAEPVSERAAAQYGDFQRKRLDYFKQIHNFKKTKLHKLICSCLTVVVIIYVDSGTLTLYHEARERGRARVEKGKSDFTNIRKVMS